MFSSLKKKKRLIREIIQICEIAITEWETGILNGIIRDIAGGSRNGFDFYYNQVKNMILPEMKRLLVCAEEKGTLRGHRKTAAKYSFILLDTWNNQSPLSRKISELCYMLKWTFI